MKKKLLFILILNSYLFSHENLYFIDMHSQIDKDMLTPQIILDDMKKNGVKRTFISKRGNGNNLPKKVRDFAKNNPKKIYALISTKQETSSHKPISMKEFVTVIDKQLSKKIYKGFAETIIYHGAKWGDANLRFISLKDKKIQYIIEKSIKNSWPVILHIEFQAAGFNKNLYLQEFEEVLDKYNYHPFILQSFGQLYPNEILSLIKKHNNLYFSTSNSVGHPHKMLEKDNSLWVRMFNGSTIKPEWEKIVKEFPERIIFAMDRVFLDDWDSFKYEYFIKVWRDELNKLPKKTAHLIAHENAERLWNLKR